MSELDKFRKMLAHRQVKEAAEWLKASPHVAFSTSDTELRTMLYMLADAILENKVSRLSKFTGNKLIAEATFIDQETGAKIVQQRRGTQAEWEREIYNAVMPHVDPATGRVKAGTYSRVAKLFDTGDENVKGIWNRLKANR